MVERLIISSPNVVDFGRYRRDRIGSAFAVALRACRHCGATMLDGESEDDCSTAFNVGAPPRRFYVE